MKDVLKDIKISQIEMILNNLLFKDISDMSEKNNVFKNKSPI